MARIKFGLLLKFSLSLALVIILSSAILSVLMIHLEKMRVEWTVKEQGLTAAQTLAHNCAFALLAGDLKTVKRLTADFGKQDFVVYAQVLDNRGNILAKTSRSLGNIVSTFNLEVPIKSIVIPIKSVMAGPGNGILYPFDKKTPVKNIREMLIGEVKIGVFHGNKAEVVNDVLEIVLLLSLSIMAAGILGIYLLVKYFLVNPLHKFLAVTREVARSELDQKIILKSSDELGELANAFNAMTANLKQSREEIESYTKTLEEKVIARTRDLENSRKVILQMMENIKDDYEKLKVVDRMKTEFLSMVSHELHTPLTPIKGYLSLLLTGKIGEVTADQRKALEILYRQSEHLHALIDNVLDFSRLELGKPIPLNKKSISLQRIIEEMAETMKTQAKDKDLKITLELQEGLPSIMGDMIKIKRIITNLLGNAIKFSTEHGEIKLRAAVQDKNIRLEVVDNGIGIAKENLEKVFEKFYQVDSSITRVTNGIGMGLTITKELVGLHGGEIRIESEGLNKGTKVIVLLPIA